MLRLAILAAAAAPLGAWGQPVLDDQGIAGLGVQGCETIAGAQNTPVLAGTVDWGLGYLAGRRDAGHDPVEGEPLSTTDSADLAVGILLYCRENPQALVLDALRAYGRRVYGEGPSDDPASRPRLPGPRPVPRPDDGPAPDLLARIDAARIEAEIARIETAAAAATLSVVTGPAGLAARAAAGSLPPGAVVSRGTSDLGTGLTASGRAGDRVGAAPVVSPRPPRRGAAPVRRNGPF